VLASSWEVKRGTDAWTWAKKEAHHPGGGTTLSTAKQTCRKAEQCVQRQAGNCGVSAGMEWLGISVMLNRTQQWSSASGCVSIVTQADILHLYLLYCRKIKGCCA
jgi:hypothetical protein